ncbi:MAG: hypothetical protein ACR2LK_04410 [Solirubrobacteraceae bacterium]
MTDDHVRDPFLEAMVRSAAMQVHDAEERCERVRAMEPELTADTIAAFQAWSDQRDAAKAARDCALHAQSVAIRLATGRDVNPIAAEVIAHAVNVRGAREVCKAFEQVAPIILAVGPAVARSARPRAARRPRAQATRSSARSGDGPGEQPADSAARRSDQ